MNFYQLSDYINNWLLKDIEREIEIARAGETAGNVLCALGLMAYTEFMGTFLYSNGKLKSARDTFNSFFSFMGEKYRELIEVKKLNIYDIFRCGLAHEYFIKEYCTIAMLNSSEGEINVKGAFLNENVSERKPSILIKKPVDCGIIYTTNGSYLMVIEKYFIDFKMACKVILDSISKTEYEKIPIKDYPYMSDSG